MNALLLLAGAACQCGPDPLQQMVTRASVMARLCEGQYRSFLTELSPFVAAGSPDRKAGRLMEIHLPAKREKVQAMQTGLLILVGLDNGRRLLRVVLSPWPVM
jgi:hypothetical protein